MLDEYGNKWGYRAKWAYLLLVVFALLAPVFHIICVSFNEHGFAARIYDFTFSWYVQIPADTILVASLEWTFYLAVGVIFTSVPANCWRRPK